MSKSKKDSLGDRMKSYYENRGRFYLTRKIPVIIRVDGRAFHSLELDKPFDDGFIRSMVEAAAYTSREIQGFKLAYVQSDEVSFVLTDYDSLETQAWFDYNKSKIESVTASLMTVAFKHYIHSPLHGNRPYSFPFCAFDARSFNIPREEIPNYFLWRVKDWERNSVSMYARNFFSHRELHKQRIADIHEMLYEKGKNWTTDLTGQQKNGTFILRKEMGGSNVLIKDWVWDFDKVNALCNIQLGKQ